MMTYSLALRNNVLAKCDAGLTTRQVAERYGGVACSRVDHRRVARRYQ